MLDKAGTENADKMANRSEIIGPRTDDRIIAVGSRVSDAEKQ